MEIWFGKLTPDGVLTVCVLLLQLFLIWKTYQFSREAEARSQRHDRLSVRPLLDFACDNGPGYLRIVAENHGLGVAIVSEVELWIDGIPYRPALTSGNAVLRFLAAAGISPANLTPGVESRMHDIAPPVGLKTGGTMGILDLHMRPSVDTQTLSNRVAVRVNYKSIYEDESFAAVIGDVPNWSAP